MLGVMVEVTVVERRDQGGRPAYFVQEEGRPRGERGQPAGGAARAGGGAGGVHQQRRPAGAAVPLGSAAGTGPAAGAPAAARGRPR